MHDNGCILYPREAKIINDGTEDHEMVERGVEKPNTVCIPNRLRVINDSMTKAKMGGMTCYVED